MYQYRGIKCYISVNLADIQIDIYANRALFNALTSNRPYKCCLNWTGINLQWRLMQGNIIKRD